MGTLLLRFADLLEENEDIGYEYSIQITLVRVVYLLTYPLFGGIWLVSYLLAGFYWFGLGVNLPALIFFIFFSAAGGVCGSMLVLSLTYLFVLAPTDCAIAQRISGLSKREAYNLSVLEFETLFREWNENQNH